MPDLKTTKGHRYWKETRFDRETIMSRPRPKIEPAPPFKTYPDAQSIQMPEDLDLPEADLWQTLAKRRSERRYEREQISFLDLARLLWAVQGVTAQKGRFLLRTAPSAGGLFPVETYVVADLVQDLDPGVYHLNVPNFALERLSTGEFGGRVAQAALDQKFLAGAAVHVVFSCVFRRNMAKYGHRGLRYVLMDVGHMCQNLVLASTALNLRSCPVAAFYDNEINEILNLDGEEESVLYMASVGR